MKHWRETQGTRAIIDKSKSTFDDHYQTYHIVESYSPPLKERLSGESVEHGIPKLQVINQDEGTELQQK